jgi:hypothetical protein
LFQSDAQFTQIGTALNQLAARVGTAGRR